MSFDRIPKGSLILVTAPPINRAIVDAAIAHGFKVRGVTRSIPKAAQFAKHLDDKYGNGWFELVEVRDFSALSAYDEALSDVAGILHIATDTTMSTSYDVVVKNAVESTVGIMKAAANVPSIKSVVFASSRITIFAADYEQPDISPKLTEWNDHFVTMAKEAPEDHPMKSILVYAASKLQGERAAWEYHNSACPSYVFNTILPDLVIGPIFNPTPGYYSTHTGFNEVFLSNHDPFILKFVNPATLAVDVRDVASIHLAALLSTQTAGKRLWAAAHQFEINDILKIWREAFPERTFVANFDFPPQPKITLELAESVKLLEAFEGRSWVPFKETVVANVQDALLE
ncbi:hypothetical protein K438DRAFT_1941163 [Mycena galopus ATCC 62051]|nr:hypothetical protein K438DRAFT_1941163 [Mycena galopus ATCC 62051]